MSVEYDTCGECGGRIAAKFVACGLCPDCASKRVECEGCGITFPLIEGESGKDDDGFTVYLCGKCAGWESVECNGRGLEMVYCAACGASIPKGESVNFADLGPLCRYCADQARRLQGMSR